MNTIVPLPHRSVVTPPKAVAPALDAQSAFRIGYFSADLFEW